jgi:hypothetical protein
MNEKELAIRQSSIFLADRVTVALQTKDRKHLTIEAIEELLRREFQKVPDGGEAKL